MKIQTILGAGGTIGKELAGILPEYTDHIRLVSRNPRKINPDDELFPGDLNDPARTDQAVAGSEVVYLTAGLSYRTKVWQEQWPRIMENVIRACGKNGAKLVFFDNIYCYGKVKGPLTENSPYHPSSEKGKVRARIAQMLADACDKGEITGAIVRAADFYGPHVNNAAFNMLVLNRLQKKKKAQWLCNDRVLYSMTYAPDAARGTALVGNTPDAMDQIWHLPTSEPLTANELIVLSAEAAGTSPKHTVLKRGALRLAGLFDATTRELIEMLYQYENDYIFDSSKFETWFETEPTSYREGIAAALKN